MKITAIDTVVVHAEMRNWVFVKVSTDEGLVGWGESTVEWKTRAVVGCIEDYRTLLVGEDPRRVEHIWQMMYRQHFFRPGMVECSAMSGIEHACWDITGKALGVPVYQLLGGAVRDTVRLYDHLGGGEMALGLPRALAGAGTGARPRVARARVRRDQARGRHPPHRPARRHRRAAPRRRVMAARARRGRRRRRADGRHARALLADDGGAVHPRCSSRTGRGSSRSRARPSIPQAMAELARRTTVPIATGERLCTRHPFRELLELGACSVLQPDAVHCGGISELRRIAAMGEAYHAALAPHSSTGPIGHAASMHVAFATPNFLIQETWRADVPWRFDVLSQTLPFEGGTGPAADRARPRRRGRRARGRQAPVPAGAADALLPRRRLGRRLVSDRGSPRRRPRPARLAHVRARPARRDRARAESELRGAGSAGSHRPVTHPDDVERAVASCAPPIGTADPERDQLDRRAVGDAGRARVPRPPDGALQLRRPHRGRRPRLARGRRRLDRPAHAARALRREASSTSSTPPDSPMDTAGVAWRWPAPPRTARRLGRARLGMVGAHDMGLTTTPFDVTRLRGRIGPEVESVDLLQLRRAADEVPAVTVKDEASRLVGVVGRAVRGGAGRDAGAAPSAWRRRRLRICAQKGFDAFSYKSVEGVSLELGTTHNLASSLVASAGVPYIDENDMLNLTAQLMLGWLAGFDAVVPRALRAPSRLDPARRRRVRARRLDQGRPRVKPVSSVATGAPVGVAQCSRMRPGPADAGLPGRGRHGGRLPDARGHRRRR